MHAALLREITRIGNNLNQLAKQANTGVVPVSELELRQTLLELMAMTRRL